MTKHCHPERRETKPKDLQESKDVSTPLRSAQHDKEPDKENETSTVILSEEKRSRRICKRVKMFRLHCVPLNMTKK